MNDAPTVRGRDGEQQSIGTLLGDLAKQTETLVRQEAKLASIEMKHTARRAARDVGIAAGGGALAYAGLLGLIAAAVLALGTALPLWASALIVSAVVLVVGATVIALAVRGLRDTDAVPRITVETLRDGRTWLKEQLR